MVTTMSTREMCQRAMIKAEFSSALRRASMIWAAKHQTCPKCRADVGRPCENLTSRKQGIKQATKFPHSERVDWAKLFIALSDRGYIGG